MKSLIGFQLHCMDFLMFKNVRNLNIQWHIFWINLLNQYLGLKNYLCLKSIKNYLFFKDLFMCYLVLFLHIDG